MIDEIDILHERHCCDFARHAGKKSAGLFGVVSYHHEIVVELGEYGFDSFTEPFVDPGGRTPVFLIQPEGDFEGDVGSLKEILLELGTEITLVPQNHAVMILPGHILEITDVVDTCRRHVVGMYDAAYSADCVELVAEVMYPLRGAITPVRWGIGIVTAHGAALCPCVLADPDGLGINAEHILGAVNGSGHVLSDLLREPGRELAPGVELPAADKVWQILPALMVQTMKKEVLAVEPERLRRYTERHDLKVGELRHNPATRHVSQFIHPISGEILADSENSYEICYEVAHKQTNGS